MTDDTPMADDTPFGVDNPLIVTIDNTVSSPQELDAVYSRINPVVRNILIGMQEDSSARVARPRPPLKPKHIKASFSLTFE